MLPSPRQQQAKSSLPFNLFGKQAYYSEPEGYAGSAEESDRFEKKMQMNSVGFEEMMAGSTSTQKLLVVFITKKKRMK